MLYVRTSSRAVNLIVNRDWPSRLLWGRGNIPGSIQTSDKDQDHFLDRTRRT